VYSWLDNEIDEVIRAFLAAHNIPESGASQNGLAPELTDPFA
jgi:hypothetical protein